MKNIFKALTLCLLLTSCSDNYDYTPYYNAKGMKGTEVYCWEIKENTWRCGAMSGTNRNKSLDELQYLQNDLPCTLKNMKKILSTFTDEERNNVSIATIPYPITEDNFEIVTFNPNNEITSYLIKELGLSK